MLIFQDIPFNPFEIVNIEDAVTKGMDLTEYFIRELHAITVKDLIREGDSTPGTYRAHAVRISQSQHLPPEAFLVSQYTHELMTFINQQHSPKYDLIKVALAHHRFGWIHPFGNGNGRVVRLLTYALLIKYGFNVKAGGRVLNPTAIFCNNRDKYYAKLSEADFGTNQGLEAWCVYVLTGILDELKKVDRLTDFEYLRSKIFIPAINYAEERNLITKQEVAVLGVAAKTGIAKAADLSAAMPNLTSNQRTYQIKKLVESKMLQPLNEGARQYTFGFSNNYLIRGIIRALSKEGFISATLSGERG